MISVRDSGFVVGNGWGGDDKCGEKQDEDEAATESRRVDQRKMTHSLW